MYQAVSFIPCVNLAFEFFFYKYYLDKYLHTFVSQSAIIVGEAVLFLPLHI